MCVKVITMTLRTLLLRLAAGALRGTRTYPNTFDSARTPKRLTQKNIGKKKGKNKRLKKHDAHRMHTENMFNLAKVYLSYRPLSGAFSLNSKQQLQ